MSSFGLIFFPRTAPSVAGTAELMDELGYDLLGFIDSHALAMDVYVALTLAATRSSRIRLGPCVTNPVTRDLSVTAAAVASLDLVSGGRAFLGISRGFSGAMSVGLRPGTTSSMADIVPRLRALMSGDPIDADGREMRLAWSKCAAPIMMAASGPKALLIAGRVADAVLIHVGILPAVVSAAVARIRDGAKEAGRDPDAVEIWAHGAAACSPDGKVARESVKGTVAGMGAAVFTPNTTGKHVPADLEKPIAELQREYRVTQHMQRSDDHNVRLIERLGLADYLVDRFAFAGTPDDIRKKVSMLETIGVTRFIFNLSTSPDVDATARALAMTLGISRRA
jgi:5,10-methylenetetrahydromethanopterin reductase